MVRAQVPDLRENGCHALRHFFASTALHEGETIKAVSEYLGHADPGSTLRTYTHLMEGSSERTRRRSTRPSWERPSPMRRPMKMRKSTCDRDAHPSSLYRLSPIWDIICHGR